MGAGIAQQVVRAVAAITSKRKKAGNYPDLSCHSALLPVHPWSAGANGISYAACKLPTELLPVLRSCTIS